MNSLCCKYRLKHCFITKHVEIFQCAHCGNYWASHSASQEQGDAWKSVTVTTEFLSALRQRREVQAREILTSFQALLNSGRLLDYGCGQGAFFSFLVQNGIDASGCDISSFSQELNTVNLESRFLPIYDSWSLPDKFNFSIVSMLDVLEHCPNPIDLINRFRNCGVLDFVIKVPMSSGPLFKLAKIAAHCGQYSTLEKLFLVGDIFPHESYFSHKGLVQIFDQCGYTLKKSIRLAEIGRELPNRLRGDRKISNGFKKFVIGEVGHLFEIMSPYWSDTAVFHFKKI